MAAPEGYVRPFLNAGALLVKPLRQAIIQGIQPAYAQKLLAALVLFPVYYSLLSLLFLIYLCITEYSDRQCIFTPTYSSSL